MLDDTPYDDAIIVKVLMQALKRITGALLPDYGHNRLNIDDGPPSTIITYQTRIQPDPYESIHCQVQLHRLPWWKVWISRIDASWPGYPIYQLHDTRRNDCGPPVSDDRLDEGTGEVRAPPRRPSAGISDTLRVFIFRRDGFRCRWCGASSDDGEEVRLEVDHKTPVALGGTNEITNLWTLCKRCNRGKRATEA